MDDRGNMIREGNQNAIYKRQKECRTYATKSHFSDVETNL